MISRAHRRNVMSVALTLGVTCVTPLAVLADNSIRVAGQVVFTEQASSGGMSSQQRAETIQRNLDNALVASQDRSASAVSIVYVKGVPVITLGGYQVATVSSEDAKAAGTTPALLAQRWADSIKGSLADSSSINSYIQQLSGANPAATADNGYGGGRGGSASATAGSNTAAYNPPPPEEHVPYQPYNQGGAPQGSGYNGPPNGGAYNGPQAGSGGGYMAQNGQGGGYGAPNGGQYNGGDQYNSNNNGGPGYGAPNYGNAGYNGYSGGGPGYGGGAGYGQPQRGRVAYAPAGLTLPVALRTSISTQAASAGDLIEANLTQPVDLGGTSLPPGTVLVGQVTNAKAGGFLGRSGMLGVTFNRIRTPDGMETPISAHVVCGIGKYAMNGQGQIAGETWKNKVGQGLLRGVVGAGAGAALGTAVGAIASHGHGYTGLGAGRGAWSGAAIGGGVGVADSLLLRKGRDVTIHSGTAMQVQLDAPVSISSGGGPAPYTGAF